VGRGIAKRREQGGFIGRSREADIEAGAVAEGVRRRRRQGDRRLARERAQGSEGATGSRGMDQNGVEGGGCRDVDRNGLIEGQGPGLDAAPQQGGQITGRLPGAGSQQRADPGPLRNQQGGEAFEVTARRLNLCETRRPRRLGRGVADGEDGSRPVGRQGGEGGDAIGAGEGQGGDTGQVRRDLRDRPDGQQGCYDRFEAEGGQAVGGARRARLGACDPDAADRRQGATR
jgi:hypothetical protein